MIQQNFKVVNSESLTFIRLYENQFIAVISDKDTLELRGKMLRFCHLIPTIKPPEKFHEVNYGNQELNDLVNQIFS